MLDMAYNGDKETIVLGVYTNVLHPDEALVISLNYYVANEKQITSKDADVSFTFLEQMYDPVKEPKEKKKKKSRRYKYKVSPLRKIIKWIMFKILPSKFRYRCQNQMTGLILPKREDTIKSISFVGSMYNFYIIIWLNGPRPIVINEHMMFPNIGDLIICKTEDEVSIPECEYDTDCTILVVLGMYAFAK